MEAGVELPHQVWEDWGEKTQPIFQRQSLARVSKSKLAYRAAFNSGDRGQAARAGFSKSKRLPEMES